MLGHADQFVATVHEGLRAARQLWGLTRDPKVKGPNERIVAADAARLKALRGWITRGLRPAPPRGGLARLRPWQLIFDIVLTEPALQRIVVESQGPEGAWSSLHGRTLIEFRAEAARPNARIRREFSVPVEDPAVAAADRDPRHRARDGLAGRADRRRRPRCGPRDGRPRALRVLGRRAARSGFPDLDWARNEEAVAPQIQAVAA
jgi:hypothetical protein